MNLPALYEMSAQKCAGLPILYSGDSVGERDRCCCGRPLVALLAKREVIADGPRDVAPHFPYPEDCGLTHSCIRHVPGSRPRDLDE
jgi:hypothetical protein